MTIVASLKELETVLLETPVPDVRDSHAEDPNYVQQFKAFRGISEALLDPVDTKSLQ